MIVKTRKEIYFRSKSSDKSRQRERERNNIFIILLKVENERKKKLYKNKFILFYSLCNRSMSTVNFETYPLKSSERIREKVQDRHWQLFETRLKTSQPSKYERTNYTKSNDYRIIDRLKQPDQTQMPIEPKQRWDNFCSQLTNKSNETNRLLSIFHNVWIKNWNTTTTVEQTKINPNENQLFKYLITNEHEKKIISSILHQNI